MAAAGWRCGCVQAGKLVQAARPKGSGKPAWLPALKALQGYASGEPPPPCHAACRWYATGALSASFCFCLTACLPACLPASAALAASQVARLVLVRCACPPPSRRCLAAARGGQQLSYLRAPKQGQVVLMLAAALTANQQVEVLQFDLEPVLELRPTGQGGFALVLDMVETKSSHSGAGGWGRLGGVGGVGGVVWGGGGGGIAQSVPGRCVLCCVLNLRLVQLCCAAAELSPTAPTKQSYPSCCPPAAIKEGARSWRRRRASWRLCW